MSLKVQHPLPTIGLELYQLGVHIRAKKGFVIRIIIITSLFYILCIVHMTSMVLLYSNPSVMINFTSQSEVLLL